VALFHGWTTLKKKAPSPWSKGLVGAVEDLCRVLPLEILESVALTRHRLKNYIRVLELFGKRMQEEKRES